MERRIQLRRDTAARWTSFNPVLAAGEFGVELDTYKFKIGDGFTDWIDLDYASAQSAGQVDVMSFGAVGDGLTDDSPAIQEAIEFVRSNGGGRVIFPMPPNFYRCDQTITLHTEFVLVGEVGGFHNTLGELTANTGTTVGQIRCIGGSTPWSRGDWYKWDGSVWQSGGRYQVSGSNVVIKDYSGIALVGESLGIHRTRLGVRVRGMDIPADENGYRHLISAKGIAGNPGGGIANYPVDAFFIQDLCFRGVYNDDAVGNAYDPDEPWGAALYLDTIEQFAMINCRVDATNGYGVWIENSLDCCFTNMLVEECEVGFYISRGNHTHIHNVTTCINRGAGMIITDDGADPYGTRHGTHGLIVTGSNFRNNNRDNLTNDLPINRRNANGLYMENAHNCMIVGNHFADDYAGDYVTETYGIQMQQEGIYIEQEDLTLAIPIAGSSVNTREHITRPGTNNVISGNFTGGNTIKKNNGIINKAYGTILSQTSLSTEEYITVGIDAPNWQVGVAFEVGDFTNRFEIIYKCVTAHTSSLDNVPSVGAQWVAYSTQPRFTKIGDAVDYYANKSPQRANQETIKGWIGILPGYIIDERIRVSGVNLAHINIIHINQYAFTTPHRLVNRNGKIRDTIEEDPMAWKTLGEGEYFPFLSADKGGVTPSIHTTFICSDVDYDDEPLGTVLPYDYRICGLYLTEGSKCFVQIGGSGDPLFPNRFGFKGFDGLGARVVSGSYLHAPLSDFSNNGIGVDISNGQATIQGATITGCGTNNTGRAGLPALGTFPFQGIGCRAMTGATLEATGANLSGATYRGVTVSELARAILIEANVRLNPSTNSVNDLAIFSGGIVVANGMIGGMSATPNQLTSTGIIFQV